MKKIIALLTAIVLSMAAGAAGSFLFDVNPLAVAGLFFGANILMPAIPGIAPLLIGIAPGGIGVGFQIQLTYLPQFLHYNDAGAPLNWLRIESQEDGMIQDYNAAAIAAVNGFMKVGALAANDVILNVADGEIRGRNVIITGETSAVGAINIFASSDKKGKHPFKLNNAAIVALNPTQFKDFAAIFAPTMAAGDTVQVNFRDGHRQTFAPEELQAISTAYQQAPGIIVNNINAYISMAEFQTAAATPAYVLSYMPSR